MSRSIVTTCPYGWIEVADLPQDVQDDLAEDCSGDGTARLINPMYHAKFRHWLQEHGHNDSACYMCWWSW